MYALINICVTAEGSFLLGPWQKDFATGSSSLVSNWEDVAFHTDLEFLCSVPYSTAKLKEEEVVEGSAGLCPWRLNCCE